MRMSSWAPKETKRFLLINFKEKFILNPQTKVTAPKNDVVTKAEPPVKVEPIKPEVKPAEPLSSEQKANNEEVKKETTVISKPAERNSIESAPLSNPLASQPKTIQSEKVNANPFKKPMLFESEIENSTEMKPEEKKPAGPGKISNRISVI